MLASNKHIIEKPDMHSYLKGFRIEVIKDLLDLESIVEKWDTLLDSSICNRAFSSFTWLQHSYSINHSLEPFVILAYKEERLMGILPLAHHLAENQLMFPSNLCDYSDIIIRKNDWVTAEVLLDFLISVEDQYKNIMLKCLRNDSNILSGISKHSKSSNYLSCISQITRFNCPYIDLPNNVEDFLSSKSKSFRYDVKRKERKAAQLGFQVILLDHQTFPANEVAQHFLRLHEARLGDKSGLVTIQDVRTFIQSAFPILFKKGVLLPFVLMHKSKVMGMQLYMLGPDGLAYWNGGFQSQASKLSPGTLTFMAAIRHTINLGLKEFDLLRGEEAYKLKWNNNMRILHQFNSQKPKRA